MNRPERDAEERGHEPGRVTRSRDDRWLLGVCGGLATHFGVSPLIVRLLFMLSAVVTMGLAVIAYLILGAVIPEDDAG